MKIKKYIDWYKTFPVKTVTPEEFREIYDRIREKGRKAKHVTKATDWIYDNMYYLSYKKTQKYMQLYVREDGKSIRYKTSSFDPNKKLGQGSNAIKRFNEKFSETYPELPKRTAMFTAYGNTEEEFKYCIPKQFYYIQSNLCGKELEHISSIDGTSSYPSNACGMLPDANTAVRYEGTVKPTKEYPFAFYLKSGFVAEYNKYDTHEWMKSRYCLNLFDDDHQGYVNPKDDITVLMKASNYTLDSIWEYFYERRKDDEQFKVVMNATIGNFHRKKYAKYKYAHLAAVIIARANDKHLKMIEKIGVNNIIHICVDGIIYKGNTVYGIDEKKLGTYYQEFTDCRFMMKKTNVYMAMKGNEVVKYKHGGLNRNIFGMEIEEPRCFEDMNLWTLYDPLKEIRDEVDN